jgi:hypothetical protein
MRFNREKAKYTKRGLTDQTINNQTADDAEKNLKQVATGSLSAFSTTNEREWTRMANRGRRSIGIASASGVGESRLQPARSLNAHAGANSNGFHWVVCAAA